MTVGRDQVAFLSALTLVGVVVYATAVSRQPVAYLKARMGTLAVMAAVGGALFAVPSILTMQFLATSTRPSFGFGVAAMGSLPPESLATVLFGNVFGSLRWTYDYWGPTGTASPRAPGPIGRRTTSSPAPCPPCCFCGTASRADGFAREFRFFLIVGTLAVLYALGRYTPGFEMIFDHFPGVNLYRRPADATFLINVALAVASGYLVHRYVKDGNPRLIRSLRRPTEIALPLIAAALFVAAIASALVFASRAGQMTASVREIALGVLAAAAAVAIVMRLGPRWRLTAAAGLVAATGAELIARHAASALNAEPAERYAVFQQLPPEQLQGLQVLKTELAARNARGERPRIEILGLGGAWQNASMVLGLEDTIGYNPLRIADYERAVGPGENAVDPNLRTFPATFRGYKCRLASLLGLEYLVLDRPLERLPRHFPVFRASSSSTGPARCGSIVSTKRPRGSTWRARSRRWPPT